jgi:hypothetical protein
MTTPEPTSNDKPGRRPLCLVALCLARVHFNLFLNVPKVFLPALLNRILTMSFILVHFLGSVPT